MAESHPKVHYAHEDEAENDERTEDDDDANDYINVCIGFAAYDATLDYIYI